jgi:hypothetical protein
LTAIGFKIREWFEVATAPLANPCNMGSVILSVAKNTKAREYKIEYFFLELHTILCMNKAFGHKKREVYLPFF